MLVQIRFVTRIGPVRKIGDRLEYGKWGHPLAHTYWALLAGVPHEAAFTEAVRYDAGVGMQAWSQNGVFAGRTVDNLTEVGRVSIKSQDFPFSCRCIEDPWDLYTLHLLLLR